jgi:predicted transcriptional regulator
MIKMTVDLPDELRARVSRLAVEQNRAETAVVRDALETYLARRESIEEVVAEDEPD